MARGLETLSEGVTSKMASNRAWEAATTHKVLSFYNCCDIADSSDTCASSSSVAKMHAACTLAPQCPFHLVNSYSCPTQLSVLLMCWINVQ